MLFFGKSERVRWTEVSSEVAARKLFVVKTLEKIPEKELRIMSNHNRMAVKLRGRNSSSSRWTFFQDAAETAATHETQRRNVFELLSISNERTKLEMWKCVSTLGNNRMNVEKWKKSNRYKRKRKAIAEDGKASSSRSRFCFHRNNSSVESMKSSKKLKLIFYQSRKRIWKVKDFFSCFFFYLSRRLHTSSWYRPAAKEPHLKFKFFPHLSLYVYVCPSNSDFVF